MRDPTTRTVVGRSGLDRRATCTSQMGCFETVIAPLLRSQPSFEERREHCQEGQTGPIVARPRPRPTHGCLNLSKPTTSVLAERPRRRKNLHRPRSCGSGRRHIHRTVDGAIHDARVRQTIWRHRVCRQRVGRHARFWQQLRPSETTRATGCHFNFAHRVAFQPCGDNPMLNIFQATPL
jgi:hypothetical protein